MKKHMKALSLTLALGVVLTAGACGAGAAGGGGGNQQSGLQGELRVVAFDGGYGLEWLKNIGAAYKKINPKVKFTVVPTVQEATEHTKVDEGIYVGDILYGTKTTNTLGRNGKFVDIAEVYTSTPEGESKTIKEKIGESLVEEYFHDAYTGEYYSIPVFDAMFGILYNKTSLDTMFGEGNWTIPNTTDELYSLSQRVIASGNVPFTYCMNELAGYMTCLPAVFVAQQLGQEAYLQYRNGYFSDGQGGYVEDKTGDMYVNSSAQMNALKDMSRFFEKSTNMTSEATLEMDFIKAQSYFWGNGYGQDKRLVAFMANGDFMYNEMAYLEAIKHADIRFMKTPITSSIIETTPTIFDDIELSALIDAIDAGSTSLTGEGFSYDVSQEDFDKIAEARKFVYSDFGQQIMSIPHNAKNYGLAKDFLAFMCSDTAQMMKSESLNGDTNLINRDIIDETVMNEFMKSKQTILKDAIVLGGVNASAKLTVSGNVSVTSFPQKLYNGTYASYVQSAEWKAYFKNSYKEKRIAAGLAIE